MKKGRCIGLIGGLGVGAAIHYYKHLAEAHEKQGISLDLVMAHAEVPRILEYVAANDRTGLASYLTSFIRRLQAAGAEFAVVPAVTPHFCLRELVAASPLPVLDIFKPLLEELTARSIRKVAVFGTRFVMESELYGALTGIEVIHPHPDEVDYIHNSYVELALRGHGSEQQYKGLTGLAQRLCQRDKVETILLAGTDLAVLFNEENTHFPHLDCAALHLRAIANRSLADV